jgi:hypothetical protein
MGAPRIGRKAEVAKPAEYSGRARPVNPRRAGTVKHSSVIALRLDSVRRAG